MTAVLFNYVCMQYIEYVLNSDILMHYLFINCLCERDMHVHKNP